MAVDSFRRLRFGIRRAQEGRFQGSTNYWEERYAAGGNSGAGSYGLLATFKAEYINNFVARNCINTVIEFGCGDGHQLSLSDYPAYFGVDASRQALALCHEKFRSDSSKRFGLIPPSNEDFNLALSLDVIYHLVEEDAFEGYMRALFASSNKWVIIYSSNCDNSDFVRQFRLRTEPHVKHRRFTDWTEVHLGDWEFIRRDRNPNPFNTGDPDNTSFADFYIYASKGS